MRFLCANIRLIQWEKTGATEWTNLILRHPSCGPTHHSWTFYRSVLTSDSWNQSLILKLHHLKKWDQNWCLLTLLHTFVSNIRNIDKMEEGKLNTINCHLQAPPPPPAYVLRISWYWGFLWVVPRYTGIFLHDFKLWGESRNKQVLLVSKKKIGGNHAFFRDNKASIWKKMPCIILYFTAFYNNCCLIISKKCVVTPNFLFGFP